MNPTKPAEGMVVPGSGINASTRAAAAYPVLLVGGGKEKRPKTLETHRFGKNRPAVVQQNARVPDAHFNSSGKQMLCRGVVWLFA